MSLTVSQAADQTGISARQVRRAIEENVLAADRVGASYIIQSRQLQAFSRINHRGRNWTSETQAAALSLLSGSSVEGLDSTEKSRLKKRVANMELQALIGQIMRGRYSLRRAATSTTRDDLAVAVLPELGLSAKGGNAVLIAENASSRARELRLAQDSTGDIVVVEGTQAHRKVLEACALYIFGDVREHSAAQTWLEELRRKL
ncbi:excisionase family DNA-binding protein [Aurantimicrobium minutum]|uniref:excisionase family DNA-binding protein n=1 Tax=Aurantimicrobium minutum TaxID=708131 RepID=UPI0024770684|nr:excisionase family DNA-binding protein [Aurantimicrobium minutum]MDH6254607.1 excisionase family DNA binding protein [Aurantimicrobium minutum]